ncbi:MAG: hypothetical protein BZY83_07780 [SAR202 cluster bacterium Casp-Chloro-G2]|nr:MAG: hypothetical protein BZY83_07780 [SAR202 cluster bacterium Casp-Chloro-G2]
MAASSGVCELVGEGAAVGAASSVESGVGCGVDVALPPQATEKATRPAITPRVRCRMILSGMGRAFDNRWTLNSSPNLWTKPADHQPPAVFDITDAMLSQSYRFHKQNSLLKGSFKRLLGRPEHGSQKGSPDTLDRASARFVDESGSLR